MCHPFCSRCSCCQCLMWSLSSFTLFQIYDHFYCSWKWCAQALSWPIKLASHDSEWKIHLSYSVIQSERKLNVTAILCWQHWVGFIKLIFYHNLLPRHSCMSWTTFKRAIQSFCICFAAKKFIYIRISVFSSQKILHYLRLNIVHKFTFIFLVFFLCKN